MHENPGRKQVAILIDDGPHEGNGPAFLDLFQQEGVRVSLAYVGNNVHAHPDIARAAFRAGHQLINHSLTHGRVAEMDDTTLEGEILNALPIFEATVGERPSYYWPPYNALDDRMYAIIERGGMKLLKRHAVTFISSEDWNVAGTSAAQIRENAFEGLDDVAANADDRRIILFHEWRTETLQEMPGMIRELKSRGYSFVTIEEILRD